MPTRNDDLTYVSFPIFKTEKTADGDLVVYGKATDASVDSDEQIVDLDWSGKALTDWLSTGGNVRVQHSPYLLPAGRGMQVDTGDDGHWVKSLIVEDQAKKLVEKGVLQAYSIGIAQPKVVHDRKARGGRVVGGTLAEISLVDRPANKNCGITLVKSEDNDGDWSFGDLAEALEQADMVKTETADTAKCDVSAEVERAAAWHAEQSRWAGSEPDRDTDGSDEWLGWHEARKSAGHDGSPEGYETWLAKHADEDRESRAAYDAECAEWSAAEPQAKGALNGTQYLAKQAAYGRWRDQGANLDGSDAGFTAWLGKRDMDPNVGGGVDRDQLKAGDFVFGDERKFPVVTPGDVSDAVSSWGRYGGDKSFAEFKSALTALARRKGEAFVKELPESWNVKTAEADVAKAGDANDPEMTKGLKDCPKCGKSYHADSKNRNCERCGSKLPAAEDAAEKSGRGVPSDVDSTQGLHREPDGPVVEAYEADAGEEDGDTVRKSASYSTTRMHDALCAAYSWKSARDAYPSLESLVDALSVEALKADAGEDVVAFADMVKAAETLRAADPAALADARAALAKSFTDEYPHQHLSPGEPPKAGQFKRPYISAGHAALTATGASPRVPPSTHVPSAGDFHRGPLTSGHEAPAPSNKGRTYYTNAAKDTARQAMQNMHDHIADRFPDLCPMGMVDSPAGAPAESAPATPALDTKADSVPTPVAAPATRKAPGEKSETADYDKGGSIAADEPPAQPDVAELVKSLVAEQIGGVRESYENQIAELRRQVDELGAQPDPAQAPVRGVVVSKARTETSPVERRSLVDEARTAQQEHEANYLRYLDRMTKSGDPVAREEARKVLAKLLGANPSDTTDMHGGM